MGSIALGYFKLAIVFCYRGFFLYIYLYINKRVANFPFLSSLRALTLCWIRWIFWVLKYEFKFVVFVFIAYREKWEFTKEEKKKVRTKHDNDHAIDQVLRKKYEKSYRIQSYTVLDLFPLISFFVMFFFLIVIKRRSGCFYWAGSNARGGNLNVAVFFCYFYVILFCLFFSWHFLINYAEKCKNGNNKIMVYSFF